jgi:hypothetical protein
MPKAQATEDVLLGRLRRQVRLVHILAGAASAGIEPLPARQLHTIAYFADALAPVWGLKILDGQLLKRREGPAFPALQYDLDRLVGRGLIEPSEVRYFADSEGFWRLDAGYRLNREFSEPVFTAEERFSRFVAERSFVREVVFAISGLGLMGIATASGSDAAYGDLTVDFGAMLNIEDSDSGSNRSAEVALRIGDLVREDVRLTAAEKIHLYVRNFYDRLQIAA